MHKELTHWGLAYVHGRRVSLGDAVVKCGLRLGGPWLIHVPETALSSVAALGSSVRSSGPI